MTEKAIDRRYKKFLKIVNSRNVVERTIYDNTLLVCGFTDGREGRFRGPLVTRYVKELEKKNES